ncbi:MAG TPA: hypothetical protein VF135_10270 [Terriglobales bacterium]
MKIDLPVLISRYVDVEQPLFLPVPEGRIIYFADRLFLCERTPLNSTEEEEALLRAKKAGLEEKAELVALRAAVANLEAAPAYVTRGGRRRERIPDDVRLLVWSRDGGACAQRDPCAESRAAALPR